MTIPEQDPQSLRITGTLTIPLSELDFRFSRSGGPGGQNVNKVESKVELVFDVAHSTALHEGHRHTLLTRLASQIDTTGLLHLVSQETRSQHQNRALAVERFVALLQAALRPVKHRRPTKPTRGSKMRRLEGKAQRSETKQRRSSIGD